MLRVILISILIGITLLSYSQGKHEARKDKFFLYWGWNSSSYTNSDITFTGDDYEFTLDQVVANDRQSPFNLLFYLNPYTATVPQFNFRAGYFFHHNYSFSAGLDHMKYVVQQNQTTTINGSIKNTGTKYDNEFANDSITLSNDFLLYEHTDGLNYHVFELRRFDNIIDLNKVKFALTEGVGAGFLLPRTNVTFLNNERHDKFHLAGYGVSALLGLNITFFDVFFIQTEAKGGFINMPDIRTTPSKADRASQHFSFFEYMFVFGAKFGSPIGRKANLGS